MTDMTVVRPQGVIRSDSDSVAMGSIFVVSFVVLMAIALLALLLTWNWRVWLPVAESEKSLVHGVRSAVYTFMPYLT